MAWLLGAMLAIFVSASVNADVLDPPPHIPPERQMRFAHLSIKDGLSHGMVLRIVRDALGFMWFGTGDGLNRYDGHTFRVYKYDPDDCFPHATAIFVFQLRPS